MSDAVNLDGDDVLHFKREQYFIGSGAYKVNEVVKIINDWSQESADTVFLGECFTDGSECEFLSIRGGGWKKGKLRFRLEFIPDDPAEADKIQSPLDDLRSQLVKD